MNAVLLVAVGIVALLLGSELIVRGATRIAERLRVPSMVIGLTVVSIGTSTPELAVGVGAGLAGVGELGVGTIAGTNIVNLLLILGLSALIRPLALSRQTVRLDLPLMTGTAIIAVLLALDGDLTTLDGTLLLGIAVIYTVVIVVAARRARGRGAAADSDRAAPRRATASLSTRVQGRGSTAASAASDGSDDAQAAVPARPRRGGAIIEALALIGGLVVIVFGAEWLVDGSVDLARSMGVSDALIGLTIVAIGTSAPEIATTIVSTIRGDRDVAIGNLIGSSIYNIGLILGVTAIVAPAPILLGAETVFIDMPLMAVAALVCIPVFLTGRRVSRLEGGIFVAAYVAYLTFVLVTRL